MDWEEKQRKLIKLKKAKDILSTNEKVARLVLTGEIDKTTAKIISQYINNAIKCIELLQYKDLYDRNPGFRYSLGAKVRI